MKRRSAPLVVVVVLGVLVVLSSWIPGCSGQGNAEASEWDEGTDEALQELLAGKVDFNRGRLLVVPWRKADGSWDWGAVDGASYAFKSKSDIKLLAGLAAVAEDEETVLGVLDLLDVSLEDAVALYKKLKAAKAFKDVVFDTAVSISQEEEDGRFFRPGTSPSPGVRDFGSFDQRALPEHREFLNEAVASFASVEPVVPNDAHWDREWGSRKIRGDFAMAKEFPTQGEGTVVAVLDTGCVLGHEDLQQNLWVNEAEANGIPGVDDDGNGFVDDVHGFNFVSFNGDVTDDNGHGSHVAGIVGAVVNNTFGVVGVAPSTKIMCLKFMDDKGRGFTSAAVLAMAYAIQMNATVQNHSWGSGGGSPALLRLARLSGRLGQLVVAAAGNDGADTDANMTFPAALSSPERFGEASGYVVSVGASDEGDGRAGFSNFGVETVDLAAPGVRIFSLGDRPGEFTYRQGTSMASPMVAGTAAVVMSVIQYRIMQSDISNIVTAADKARFAKKVLMTSVDKVPSLEGTSRTGGRINLFSAIQLAVTGEPDAIVLVDATQLDPKMEWWIILLIVFPALMALVAGVAIGYCFCAATKHQESKKDLHNEMVQKQAEMQNDNNGMQTNGMQQQQQQQQHNGAYDGPPPPA